MRTFKTWFVRGIAVVGLLAVSAVAPAPAGAQAPPPAPGQSLRRLASNFTSFDGIPVLINSDATAGGVEIYDQTVKSPAAANVMYITLQATANAEFDDCPVGVAVNCKVDGINCNGGFGFDQDFDALPPGWIEATGNATNFTLILDEDIAWMPISYTWCTPVAKTKKNLHVVELFAGNDEDEALSCEHVLQTVSVYVDENKPNKANTDLGNSCAAYPNPNPI